MRRTLSAWDIVLLVAACLVLVGLVIFSVVEW